MKKYDVLIGGYYGFGNLGDEAILESIIMSLRSYRKNAKICVLSAEPVQTARKYGVCSVKRDDFAAVLYAMSKSSSYISGGGSLLQDSTSRRSLYYYSALMILGKLITGRLYVFANGIGDLRQKKLAAAALRMADTVSVRDPLSALRTSKMGVEPSALLLSADPAFLLPQDDSGAEYALNSCGIGKDAFFAVSVRKTADGIDLSAIEEFAARENAIPLFISMEDSYDLGLCRGAAALCGGKVLRPKSYAQLIGVLARAEFAIGMRLHFLIAAAMANIPFAAMSYDTKTEAFMSYIGSNAVIPAGSASAKDLRKLKMQMKAPDIDGLRERAAADAAVLAKKVWSVPLVNSSSREREKIQDVH